MRIEDLAADDLVKIDRRQAQEQISKSSEHSNRRRRPGHRPEPSAEAPENSLPLFFVVPDGERHYYRGSIDQTTDPNGGHQNVDENTELIHQFFVDSRRVLLNSVAFAGRGASHFANRADGKRNYEGDHHYYSTSPKRSSPIRISIACRNPRHRIVAAEKPSSENRPDDSGKARYRLSHSENAALPLRSH